jgi:hypothetical protein
MPLNFNSNQHSQSTRISDPLKAKHASSLLRSLNRNPSQPLPQPLPQPHLLQQSTIVIESPTIKYKPSDKIESQENNPKDNGVYPVSLYNKQTRLHENFEQSIRRRNDTFYYVSFRRVSLKIINIVFSNLYLFFLT